MILLIVYNCVDLHYEIYKMEKIGFFIILFVFIGIVYSLGEFAIPAIVIVIACVLLYSCMKGDNNNYNQNEEESYEEEYYEEDEPTDYDLSGLPDHVRVPRR